MVGLEEGRNEYRFRSGGGPASRDISQATRRIRVAELRHALIHIRRRIRRPHILAFEAAVGPISAALTIFLTALRAMGGLWKADKRVPTMRTGLRIGLRRLSCTNPEWVENGWRRSPSGKIVHASNDKDKEQQSPRKIDRRSGRWAHDASTTAESAMQRDRCIMCHCIVSYITAYEPNHQTRRSPHDGSSDVFDLPHLGLFPC